MRAEHQELFDQLPPMVQASLLRIGRRILEGFDGVIEIQARKGSVGYIKWSQTETGDVIRSELAEPRRLAFKQSGEGG